MKRGQRWTICTIALTAILLTIATIIVIEVDPFWQYKVESEKWEYPTVEAANINAGVAKNENYKAMLTGSSVTVNFPVSLFDKDTIKLSAQGLRMKGEKEITETALENNPGLESVYWGIDIFNLTSLPDKTGPILPEYLYNDNYFDDINYLWNKDVLFSKVPEVINYTEAGNETPSMDDRYSWYYAYYYSEKRVLESVPNMSETDVILDEVTAEEYKKCAMENINNNLIPLLEAYPEVEFNVFFPPVSICYWKVADYNLLLEIEKDVVEELLKYDNVNIFNFQSEKEIITNLYLYKDSIHYKEDVDKWMIQCLNEGKKILTSENYETELDAIKTIINEYDWSFLLQREGTFRNELDLEKYLSMIEHEDCVAIVLGNLSTANEEKLYFINELNRVGLSELFLSDVGVNYIQILDNGELVIDDEVKETLFCKSYKYNDLNIEIKVEEMLEFYGSSINYNSGIYIDGVRYCSNSAECNIVIWDKSRERVVDVVEINLESGELIHY